MHSEFQFITVNVSRAETSTPYTTKTYQNFSSPIFAFSFKTLFAVNKITMHHCNETYLLLNLHKIFGLFGEKNANDRDE